MIIANRDKAKEILSDIGYYRLGFYWFPFEEKYPDKRHRDHKFKAGTSFDHAVTLYYFDQDLRNILSPYLQRIEIHLRTTLIYIVSNHYKDNPTWFADPKVVASPFLNKLPTLYDDVRRNDVIRLHHAKYINDKYAPAWKTVEYMTFGTILFLIDNLRNQNLREQIASHIGISNLKVFRSHTQSLRILRNICAHGHNLFDLRLSTPIKPGPLKSLTPAMRSSIVGTMKVMAHILGIISHNRLHDFKSQVNRLLAGATDTPIYPVIKHIQSL